jgi:outer membrane murein-binding lipoprotein Lpp
MKDSPPAKTPVWAVGLLAATLFAPVAHAAWHIDQSAYNAFLCQQVKVPAACGAPPVLGRYPSKPDCDRARLSGRMALDRQWTARTFCTGFDDPKPAPRAATPATQPSGATRVPDADFEKENAELVASLKDVDASPAAAASSAQAAPHPGARAKKPNRALQDLDCSAYWALVAAREADGDALEGARGAAEKSAQAQRVGKNGCPPPKQADLPQPHPVIDESLSPSQALSYQEIIEAAQALKSSLVQTRDQLALAQREKDRLQAEMASIKARAESEADAQTAGALSQLERKISELETSIRNLETRQRQLRDDLDVLQRRYESAARKNDAKK